MNKTAIKNYAVEARKKWIQAIAQQAAFYGCTEKDALGEAEITTQLADKGVFLTANEKSARSALVNDINEKGYQNAIEEIAYTWFNRLIAIRFMEVNGFLPSGIRVLSSIDADRIEPDCVREYARLDFLNQDTATKLAAESDEKLYRYILVEQCNALGKIMPKMFTHIGGIAALLLPERLYIKDGLVHDLTHIKDVDEKDFGEQIETIGWLYQYYISEKKDEVFAALKKNVKITRENIPAATQLFTPEWIVKYMVENSLGRLWLESHPDSKLREGWKYYIDEAEQEPAVAEQLRVLRAQNPVNKPEDIKLIDPCMGSGHILVYAFDVLHQIYQSQGYAERDIPDLILENNIYGLDIDERACQLAYFALMMKGRSYNRRFFRQDNVPQPQVYSPQADEELLEYGSLYKVDTFDPMPEQEFGQIALEDIKFENKLNDWNFRRLLHQKYDVVVTNPPYMGSSGMGTKLSEYVKKNYSDSKSDMFAVFVEKCDEILKSDGFQAMITMHSWMFLNSFELLRSKMNKKLLFSLLQLGIKAFEEIGNDVVQTCTFVYQNTDVSKYISRFCNLVECKDASLKETLFLEQKYTHELSTDQFLNIPGGIIAYWASESFVANFVRGKTIEEYGDFTGSQNITGSNDRYLRCFWEVDKKDIDQKIWVFYAKGGDYRKYYGNLEIVIDWRDSARNFYSTNKTSNLLNEKYWFREGITYSAVTSRGTGFRYLPPNSIFDKGGPSIMLTSHMEEILALLNSKVAEHYFKALNPSINLQVKDIKSFPIILPETDEIETLASENISIAKADWDAFETSFNFECNPLVTNELNKISDAFSEWKRLQDKRLKTTVSNEHKINKHYAELYHLKDEVTIVFEERDFPVRRADLGREIRSFISYAVGCMFGRYSLDVPGFAYAGGEWDKSKYSSYIPEDDNILPITDADYFEDDIVMRFVDFVKVVYGEATLAENLEFIARALYPNAGGTARESIRRYFQNDFFKNHCKIYQKRPIYWLFDSGKQNGFKALIYLHRYDKYTVARVRTEYLHPLQRKYEAEIERMNKLAHLPETSARDKVEFRKQTEKIEKQITECRAYDQIISHIAAQTIELDLDDGVKVNYEKFQGVEVPRDDGKGAVKMDLLGKV